MKDTKENDALKFAMIERWHQSKQSKTQFCKTENIAFHVFYYWHTKYTKQNNTSCKFIKIAALDIPQMQSNYCELHFTNGLRLVFSEMPTADYLKQLI